MKMSTKTNKHIKQLILLSGFCMGLKLIFHINLNNLDHKIRSFPSRKYCDSFMNQGGRLCPPQYYQPPGFSDLATALMSIIFSMTMGNSSLYLSQNLSIENKLKFETLLCQVRIVKTCEKQLKQKAHRI